jgi:hypothetical protein
MGYSECPRSRMKVPTISARVRRGRTTQIGVSGLWTWSTSNGVDANSRATRPPLRIRPSPDSVPLIAATVLPLSAISLVEDGRRAVDRHFAATFRSARTHAGPRPLRHAREWGAKMPIGTSQSLRGACDEPWTPDRVVESWGRIPRLRLRTSTSGFEQRHDLFVVVSVNRSHWPAAERFSVARGRPVGRLSRRAQVSPPTGTTTTMGPARIRAARTAASVVAPVASPSSTRITVR